nr:hypothetical protein GCM10025699_16290 [Microbacterium flavescens]
MSTDITATLAELEQAAGRPERFSRVFLEVLPVTGASVSTIGDVLGSETISATDDLAGRLDELQFDLTEGPCWDAIRTDSVISEPDFTGKGAQRWPTFGRAVPSGEVASMFAFLSPSASSGSVRSTCIAGPRPRWIGDRVHWRRP